MDRIMQFPGLIRVARCRSFGCACPELSCGHGPINIELQTPEKMAKKFSATAGVIYNPRQHYRRESASTVNLSDISGYSSTSLWNRSISSTNVSRALHQYQRRLEKAFNDEGRSRATMSDNWELISKIITNGDGDLEALPYLIALCKEDSYEATHVADISPPHWTILHKLCLYGCPRCTDFLVKFNPDYLALDINGNRPLDLARYCESPNHRDVTATVEASMRMWRIKEAQRRADQAKARANDDMSLRTAVSLGDYNEDRNEGGDDDDDDDDDDEGEAGGSRRDGEVEGFQASTGAGQERRSRRQLRRQSSGISPSPAQGTRGSSGTALRSLLRWISSSWTANGQPIAPLTKQLQSDEMLLTSQSSLSPSHERLHNDVRDDGTLSSLETNSLMTDDETAYSRARSIETTDTSVREGRRAPGPRVGPTSKLVDPAEKAAWRKRRDQSLKLTREIYRTDFKSGTFSSTSLPHVGKTIKALMANVPTLDARLQHHIDEDMVDEKGEYREEAAVVRGELTMGEFLEGKGGPGRPGAGRGYDGESLGRATLLSRIRDDASSVASTNSWGKSAGMSAGAVTRAHHSTPAQRAITTKAERAERRAQRAQQDRVHLKEKNRRISNAAKRLQKAARSDAISTAAEVRYREAQASLSSPPWIPGSQQCHDTLLYKEARKANAVAQQMMADVPRLQMLGEGSFLPGYIDDVGIQRSKRLALPVLGSGSHSYRIGRVGSELQHASDQRVASLEALRAQRKKKWWAK